ncbi:MAG: L-lactate dehydrogenase [Phaeodactylibacter sp.]|nr:L-lactate dehydrogenase [Phaeodactylibacter sp.]MCB9263815.1 L-lactate dehydrogenase [Lewinellaceae bacterium]MCB9288264.1 L-lactate dehydrogenase [Lewinellaceae bacterium]
MNSEKWKSRKVVVVGAGDVGATFAFSLAQSGLADEIALIDLNKNLVAGQVLDLSHGMPYYPPVSIHEGDKEDYADAQAIVITAGASQRPGESRLELLQRNARIMEGIVDDIIEQGSAAVILIVANPVDILTRVALERSGWDRSRVIGSGTVLDSARFRYLISRYCGVGVHNVHAYILGEHGDSEFAAWSLTNIGGVPVDAYCMENGTKDTWQNEKSRIEEQVRRSAYHIIDYKGSTYYAVALALVRIIGAILRNQSSVLTVSVLLQGEYGQEDVCISVPCLVDGDGMKRVIKAELTETESEALARSAEVLRKAYGVLA